MNHVDPNWIETQHRSFLNWTNSQLRNKNVQLTNLTDDLKSGEHLIELLSELLHKTIPIPTIQPQYRIQMMNNLTEALEVIKKECDISLVNIDSNDIVDGNTKLVLALIHSLMYKYQVCKAMSDDRNVIDKNTPMTVVERQLIDWLNSILYNSQPVITNISSDWTNGEHLKNLVQYFLPNSQPIDWNSMDPTQKIGESIRMAEKDLNIPKILEAQDIANGPDSFSMLAYLSYFRMVKKQQENKILSPIEQESSVPVVTNSQQPVVVQIPPQQIPVYSNPTPMIVKTPQPTVSSVNYDDISSAPPMSPPSQDDQFHMNNQRPVMVQNNDWANQMQPQQQLPPQQQHYQHQPQRPTLANSAYLPDQSNNQFNQQAHISSLYSPGVGSSTSIQPIPQIPPQQNQFNNQSLMVPPPMNHHNNMMMYPQAQQAQQFHHNNNMMMMNPYHQFTLPVQQPMMQGYSPQMSPQVSPMIVTTTTTTNNQQVFTADNMQYDYYQFY